MDSLVTLFQDLIRNACVNTGAADSGQEHRNVETLQRFFASYGLKGQVLELRPGRPNLLLRFPGTQPGAPRLALMGHTDVVPARDEDWTHPPFGAELHGGEVWGRGAVDMLCWTAAQAWGLAEAYKAGERWPGDVLYLALADEEASGTYGARFLTREHWDLVACDTMVTELGGFFVDGPQGPAAAFTVGEKGLLWLKITARGTSGHGSMPYAMDNALIRLARAAQRLADHRPRVHRPGVVKAMAQELLGPAAGADRWAFNVLGAWDGPLARLTARNPGRARFLQTAAQTTLSPNLLSAGTKTNLIPDRGELLVDIRFPPEAFPNLRGPEPVLEEVRRLLGPLSPRLSLEVQEFFPPTESSWDHPVRKASAQLLARRHPEARLFPFRIGGVTDGRYWRARGTQVFGFTLFDSDLTMDAYGQRIHGVDERISVASLTQSGFYFRHLPSVYYSQL